MEPSSVSCQRTVKLAVSFHPLFDRDLFAVRGDHLEVSQVQVDRVVEVRAERPLLDRVEPGSAIEPIGSNVSPLTVHARPEPRRKSNRRSLELTGSELATVMNISLEGELTGRLAQLTVLSSAAITRLADRLVERGFVARGGCPRSPPLCGDLADQP